MMRRFSRLACLTVLCAAAANAIAQSAIAANDAASAKEHAAVAAANLHHLYEPSTGLFCSGAGGDCWWWSANEMTALVDHARLENSADAVDEIANTFEKARFLSPQKDTIGPFLDSWTDDDGWWGLAWLDAYDYAKTYDPTHADRYLGLAKNIFTYVASQWETTDCGGGLWQNLKPTHTKDAIANELFLSFAASLYRHTGDAQYNNWAMREWSWFNATGIITPHHLVLDHLASGHFTNAAACSPQGRGFWTYNQGVLIGGLADLYEINKITNPKFAQGVLKQATEIADCVISKHCGGNTSISRYPLVDDREILMEGCGTNPCTYAPAYQFKGVFIRNLGRLNRITGKYNNFLAANAAAAWTKDRDGKNLFGFYWDSPFYLPANGVAPVQGSALDLFNTQLQ